MSEDTNQQPVENPSDRIRKAFDLEFERFSGSPRSLEDAEALLQELEELRIRFLKKKSELAAQKKRIGSIEPALRPNFALALQKLEQDIRLRIDEKGLRLRTFVFLARTESETLDVTIPGRRARPGHLHPITLMRQRIEDIFVSLGSRSEE